MPFSEDEIEGELVSRHDRRTRSSLLPSRNTKRDYETVGASGASGAPQRSAIERVHVSVPPKKPPNVFKVNASDSDQLDLQTDVSDENQKSSEGRGSGKQVSRLPVPKLPRELQRLVASRFGVMTAAERGLQMPDPLLRSGRLRRPSSPKHRRRRFSALAADLPASSEKQGLGTLSFPDHSFDVASTEAHYSKTFFGEHSQECGPKMESREDSYFFSDDEV